MGVFDLFKRKTPIEKHGERVAKKRGQATDRWESIQALGKIATTEPEGGKPDEREAAVGALMTRFTFYVDPTITDGEEKDETFRWICEAGTTGVPAVRTALRKQESLSWGLKCLEHLLDEEGVMEEILSLLETMDTEYERDPQRKLQLLGTLEEKRGARIAKAVAPFFADVNESARFHAMGAALAQENAEDVRPDLLEALEAEDSLRVKVRVLDLLAEREWSLGDRSIELPEGYHKDKRGIPRKGKARGKRKR